MKEKFIWQSGTHILYDDTAVPQFTSVWFDRDALQEAGAIEQQSDAGRAPAVFFKMNGSDFVLKHYCRGGWIGRFIRDAYCYSRESAVRSFHEWRVLAQLQQLGLPVPAPCAARYRRCGLYYTADLITFRCIGASSLSQLLKTDYLSVERWREIGIVLRRFHDAGVCHADLNAHNILLNPNADKSMESIFLVDFDKARILNAESYVDLRLQDNLKRLQRSLVKLRLQLPDFFYKDADFSELLLGYRLSDAV